MLDYFSLFQLNYFTFTKKVFFSLILSSLIFITPKLVNSEIYLKRIGNDLEYPWGMDFLDENTILVTQKTGKIIKINLKNEIFEEINGLPTIFFKGQGGLLDIIILPFVGTWVVLWWNYAYYSTHIWICYYFNY